MRLFTHNHSQYAEYRWPGEAPVIHALHGFLGSGSDYSLLAENLRSELIAWDLIGFGHSEAPVQPQMYSTDSQVDFLQDILPNKAILFGYSMGARLALQFACQYPYRLTGLILVSGTAGIDDIEAQKERQVWDFQMAERVQRMGMNRFVEEWNRLPIIHSQKRIERSHREQMLAARHHHSPLGVANSMRYFGTGTMPSCWHQLSRIRVPVLIMVGSEDGKYVDIARRMADQLPSSSLAIVPSAGHCVHLEKPRDSAQAIHHWLKSAF